MEMDIGGQLHFRHLIMQTPDGAVMNEGTSAVCLRPPALSHFPALLRDGWCVSVLLPKAPIVYSERTNIWGGSRHGQDRNFVDFSSYGRHLRDRVPHG